MPCYRGTKTTKGAREHVPRDVMIIGASEQRTEPKETVEGKKENVILCERKTIGTGEERTESNRIE